MAAAVAPMPYRQDLDGLRAIAILGVVLFHAGVPGFSGGFVGVDIFFVISGYLITALIRRELIDERFSFRRFYLRRLRRLLPALFVVLLATWCMAFVLLPEPAFVTLGKTLLSSLGFASNWFFVTETGYFDPVLASNALLHTWSLSIEEQYYLLWPLLLFASRRKLAAPAVPAYVAALAALSLAVSILLVILASPQQAFFNSAGRIWELLAGAALALGQRPLSIGPRRATAMRGLGLALLAGSIGLYSPATPYPGVAAIAPVLGAVLLIAAPPGRRDLVFAGLASPPARFFGRVSYALYLWHWPLLVFARTVEPALSTAQALLVLVLALVLAAASTVLLEGPVRRRRLLAGDESFVVMLVGALMILAMLAGLAVATNGLPQRWSEAQPQADLYRVLDRGHCFIDDQPLELLTHDCLTPDPAKKNVLVIGDSYAAHLVPGLRHHFPRVNFVQATASSCRALFNFYYGPWRCPELNRMLFTQTIRDRRYDIILLASDWQVGDNLGETFDKIRLLSNAPIVVLGNTPVYVTAPSLALRESRIANVPRSQSPPPFRPGLWETDRAMKARSGPARYVSLLQNFCPGGICPTRTKAGELVHFDVGHLTMPGTIAVIGASRRDIADALGEPAPRRRAAAPR